MRIASVLGMMAATVVLASPAQASLITLNFSGTVNLSPFGAPRQAAFRVP
jgi:hypothetical protein